MQIETTLTRRDLFVFLSYEYFYNKFSRAFYLGMWGLFTAYHLYAKPGAYTFMRLAALIVAYWGIATLLLLFYLIPTFLFFLLTANHENGRIGPQTLIFKQSGITRKTSRATTKITWAHVRQLVERRSYLLIRFDDAASYIIPRRALKLAERTALIQEIGAFMLHIKQA